MVLLIPGRGHLQASLSGSDHPEPRFWGVLFIPYLKDSTLLTPPKLSPQHFDAEKVHNMAARGFHERPPGSTSSSGASTPALSASWNVPTSVSHAVTGLLRRFSSDPPQNHSHNHKGQTSLSFPPAKTSHGTDGVYTPPYRTASPFQPPPLYPVSLKGYRSSTSSSAQLLSRALAEEIRLLVPPRLQLCEEWNLVYSLDQDGVSLGTLYKKCDDLRGLRNGFVLVVRDGDGGVSLLFLPDQLWIEMLIIRSSSAHI
jgi:hypothetical protein